LDQLVLVHLSDLHICDKADFQLMEALPVSSRIIRDVTKLMPREPLYYLVSGDLTETGTAREFELASEYLLGECRVHINGEITSPVGFQLGEETRLACVPGNHDNWAGHSGPVTAPGMNRGIIGRYFHPLPWRVAWRSGLGGVELELFGMDSNAGLSDTPEILQSGAFADDHIAGLRSMLADRNLIVQPDVRRVRAIMFHHGLAFDAQLTLSASWLEENIEFLKAIVRSTAGGVRAAFDPSTGRSFRDVRPAKAYPLRFRSRNELLSACNNQQITAFLTGHNHCFARRPIPVYTPGGDVILEFQASTALRTPPPGESRGFFVHQIVLDHGSLLWHTWAFRWTGSQFRPSHNTPDYSEVV
jgi:hypothetical protein